MLDIFSYAVFQLYIFFSEMCFHVFDLFLNWVVIFLLLSFMNSLHILDNSPLSDVSLANIFFWSVACLLILLIVSFSEQKFLILMKPRLWIISSMDYTFVVVSKKSSPYWRLPRFFPVFPSRNFIILHFTFRSVIHFELVLWRV